MAVYWCTEVLPLAVTSLLPAILFPFFGIMQSKDVSRAFPRNPPPISIWQNSKLMWHIFLGGYAVLEGHQLVICGWTAGCCGCRALEFAQTHCFKGAAFCWCATSTVSSLVTYINPYLSSLTHFLSLSNHLSKEEYTADKCARFKVFTTL